MTNASPLRAAGYNSLPQEILQAVFRASRCGGIQSMRHVRAVCKAWRLAYGCDLERLKVHFQFPVMQLGMELQFPVLRSVTIQWVEKVTCQQLLQLQHLPHLRFLAMDLHLQGSWNGVLSAETPKGGTVYLFDALTQLQTLYLSLNGQHTANPTCQELEHISSIQGLCHLSIVHETTPPDSSLQFLETLTSISSLTSLEVSQFCLPVMELTCLRKLRIHGPEPLDAQGTRIFKITAAAHAHYKSKAFECLQQLQAFDINICSSVESLRRFAALLPLTQVRRLKVRYIYPLEVERLWEGLALMTQLQKLRLVIHTRTNRMYPPYLKSLTQLTSIKLVENGPPHWNFGDNMAYLTSLTNLRKIWVAHSTANDIQQVREFFEERGLHQVMPKAPCGPGLYMQHKM